MQRYATTSRTADFDFASAIMLDPNGMLLAPDATVTMPGIRVTRAIPSGPAVLHVLLPGSATPFVRLIGETHDLTVKTPPGIADPVLLDLGPAL